MNSLDAATYIIGYLTPIAAMFFICTEKYPRIAHRIAFWFFVFAIALQGISVIFDMVLR